MKRILVAIDFSDLTDKVLSTAREYTKYLDAKLCILHTEVIENYLISDEFTQSYSLKSLEERKKHTKRVLENIEREFNSYGIDPECILLSGPTVENIVSEAEKFNADLVIIGSHKHGKFYNFFIGSIHESIIHNSKIPILVIPQDYESD